MIEFNRQAFYYVYPPWAKYPFEWKKLREIFLEPFKSGFLSDEAYWKKIRYQPGTDKFQLIDGPIGNGIIKGIGDKKTDRFLWMGVLIQGTDFPSLPGFHYLAPDYGVRWLEEKGSAEHFLGLKKKAATFLPNISMDYEECDDSLVYASLAFGTKTPDEELCSRFKILWHGFGLKCRDLGASENLPKITEKLKSPVISHRWFVLERGTDDAGLLAAKAFYLGCAAKYESRRFKNIHLVGAFEDKPAMAQLWATYAQHK